MSYKWVFLLCLHLFLVHLSGLQLMCFKFDSSIKTIYFVKKFVLLKYFCIGTKFRYLYKNLNASLLKVFVFKLVTLFAGSN